MNPSGLSWTLVLLLLLVVPDRTVAEFEPRCGDCWCILNPDTDETCPPFAPGHSDELPPAVVEAYASFTLQSPPLPLLSADGSECYPFPNLSPVDKYPKSTLPACQPPNPPTEGAVCAFLFSETTSSSTCCGKEYELVTYESEAAAVAAGAVVTHTGACGVCSSAHDLAVMGSNFTLIDTQSVVCSSQYYVNVFVFDEDPNQEFLLLKNCLQDEIGYSDQCALLWAHSTATTAARCAPQCSTGADYNGPPPLCQLSSCIDCTESETSDQFEALAGRTPVNTGLTNPIARPCADYSSIVHAPCGEDLPAAGTCSGDPTAAPVEAPTAAPAAPTTPVETPTDAPVTSEARPRFQLWLSLCLWSCVGLFSVL